MMTMKEYNMKLLCYEYCKDIYAEHNIDLSIKVSEKNCIVKIDGKKVMIKKNCIEYWKSQKGTV